MRVGELDIKGERFVAKGSKVYRRSSVSLDSNALRLIVVWIALE